jgi:hypothetical protein
MVALVIPLLKLGDVYAKCRDLVLLSSQWQRSIYGVAVIAFALCWALAFWITLQALAAVDNPEKQVSGDRPEGVFYGAKLFRLGFLDALINRRVESQIQFHSHLDSVPEDDEAILKELVYEQMKLVYIRSVKLHRAKYAYRFCRTWVLLGGFLWLSWLVAK